MGKRFVAKRIGKWSGGYIRSTKNGRQAFVIELWRGGRKWHTKTGCSTPQAAARELTRFELDPSRYEPSGGLQSALRLTTELALAYRDHQLAEGLTREWTDEVARCLADWQVALGGRDIRALGLHRDLKPALEGWPTQRPHRIKAIKGFFRWLREEKGLVERAQDATLDLKVPQARPEKLRRRKIVPPEDVAAVLKHLPAVTRDILHLLTATAWHVSEARRFSEAGEIAEHRNTEGVLAVLITRHKSGDLTKTPVVHPEHLAAARRVLALEKFPKRMTLARHMRSAREKAGVAYFGMGQMRHSVITWGVRDGGASIQTAKEFAHHRSATTTKRWYLDLDIPKDVLPVYRLVDEPDA